jgi:hypothetical protein
MDTILNSIESIKEKIGDWILSDYLF